MVLDEKQQRAKNIIFQDLKEISEINGGSLDTAFKIWIIKNILHINDDLIIEEILGYENRFNTDLFYEQQGENQDDYHMYWGKIFFDGKFEHVCNKNDINAFINIPSNFESTQGDDKLSKFMQKTYSDNVKSGINQTAIFVVAGRLDEDAQKFVDGDLFESTHFGENVDVKIYQMDELFNEIFMPTTPKLSIKYEEYHKFEGSITGHVKAKEIIKNCEKHSKQIFLRNPRSFLNSTYTNKSISETLKDDTNKSIFWKLNNGITAVCRKIEENDSDENIYNFEDFKIVNGRQTTQTLIKNKKYIDDTVKILLNVHTTSNNQESIQISSATNTQNAIKPADKVSNNEFIIQFEKIIKREHENWYFERQIGSYRNDLSTDDKKRVTLRRVLSKTSMIRQYYAFNMNPFYAVKSSEDKLFKSDEIKKIFKNTKMFELIIPHIFSTALIELSKKHKGNTDYDLLRWKTVKYYVLAFIGEDIHMMEEEDKNKCFKKIYELFNTLENSAKIPDVLLDIVDLAFNRFNRSIPSGFRDLANIDLNRKLINSDEYYLFKQEHELLSSRDHDSILKKLEDM